MDVNFKLVDDEGDEGEGDECLASPLLHRNGLLTPLLDMKKQRLTLSQKTAFGVGHILNDMCAAMWFSYTLLFFQVILGMQPVIAGTMLLIGQVADAVATPIVGIYADRTGSRKTWHLLGTGLVIFSFPLIFSPCPGCSTQAASVNATDRLNDGSWEKLSMTEEWLRGIYYAGLIVVFQGGWAIVQIAHLALIPDLTSVQAERAELTAIRYTASVCSSVFMYFITWFILHLTAGDTDTIGPGDSYKFRDIVLIGLAVGVIFSLWFQFILNTPRSSPSNSTAIRNGDHLAKKQDTRSYFASSLLYQVSILYVASRLFLTLSLVYMPLYLVESLGSQAEPLATVPLVSYVSSFLSSLAVKQTSSCIGSKTLYLLGALTNIVACVWIGVGVGRVSEIGEVFGVAVLLGSGSSVTMVASLCLTADLIGSHTENGAFVYSVVTFADKLLNGIVVMIIEEFKCEHGWDCPHYYRDVLAYACGGSAILGLAALASIFWDSRSSAQLPTSQVDSHSSTSQQNCD